MLQEGQACVVGIDGQVYAAVSQVYIAADVGRCVAVYRLCVDVYASFVVVVIGLCIERSHIASFKLELSYNEVGIRLWVGEYRFQHHFARSKPTERNAVEVYEV